MSEQQNTESMAAKGGKAAAAKMTPEERAERARSAAEARWTANMPKATHEGELNIGESSIPCYVLKDGRRMISTRGVMAALGRKWRGRKYPGTELPVFLEAKNLNPYISQELRAVLSEVEFRTPRGARAEGFEARLLPLLCETYLTARDADVLTDPQKVVAKQAEILMRALAHVGVIALIDEATGYQYDRPKKELEDHLKKFLAESLRRWVRTFPADYIKHLCRLRNVEMRPDMKLPQYFGHLTNNLIYRRLAPGILKRLKERRLEKGSPSNKLHSWLSSDVGVPELLVHLGTVVGIMKLHTDYEQFVKQLDQVSPIFPEYPGLFDDPEDWK